MCAAVGLPSMIGVPFVIVAQSNEAKKRVLFSHKSCNSCSVQISDGSYGGQSFDMWCELAIASFIRCLRAGKGQGFRV